MKPFSLACPESWFGVAAEVIEFGRSNDDKSKLQGVASRSVLCERPIQESIPSLHDVTWRGPRGFEWKMDRPHALCFKEALDDGDPRKEVEHRDEVFLVDGPPWNMQHKQSYVKTQHRFTGLSSCKDGTTFVSEKKFKDRLLRTWIMYPDASDKDKVLYRDRNSEDKYTSPGSLEWQQVGNLTFPRQRPEDGGLFMMG